MKRIRLLFVCIENSNRSQMAQGFARALGGAKVDAHSAGSKPSGQVSPKAIAAMKAVGIDISRQESTGLDKLSSDNWDWIVTMGCGDACPNIQTTNRDDWELPDPRNMNDAEYAEVRDEIRRRVQQLIDFE